MRLMLLVFAILTLFAPSGKRYDYGFLESKTYHEQGDYFSATIQTQDGNLWVIDGFNATYGDRFIIEFDTRNTATVFDDEITHVIAFHSPENSYGFSVSPAMLADSAQ